MKKVIIATGGTGGHIYPALALAEVLKEKYEGIEIQFFGSSNRMESRIIPEEGYKFTGVRMNGMNGGISAKVKSLISIIKARKLCIELLKKEKPDICVGFGNYISVPLILAAHKLNIPTMISEQNSFPGKANLLLSRFADAIECAYEKNLTQFPPDKTRVYGNPEATIAARYNKRVDLKKEYGLDETKPFVLFMMGSLGSSSVSKVIDEALPMFDQEFQIIIAAGKSNEYSFTTSCDDRIKIVEYVDGKAMLNECALAVTRAGATTLCETTAIGAASVLIPSPYVPNNHQVFNAMELVNCNAAIMIEEKDLTAELLAKTVNNLMGNSELIENLKYNSRLIGKIDAAERTAEWMEELTKI